MISWLQQVLKAMLYSWLEERQRTADQILDEELTRLQRQRDEQEWYFHRRELDEFDSLLKRECKIDYLPWEQRPTNHVSGSFNQLIYPGLASMLQQQAPDHEAFMKQQAALQQAMQRPFTEMEQMLNRAGLSDYNFGQPLNGLSDLLGGLLGSQSRPSRPE